MTEKHFGVAVKGLVYHKGKYLVLKKSSTEDINPETIDIPGGRIEFGEKLKDALTREVKEETGLVVEVGSVSNTWGFIKGNNHYVGITFLCESKENNVVLSEEHTNYWWLSKEEILAGKDYPDWLKEELEQT